MKLSFNKSTLKYIPKGWTSLLFFILLVIVLFLFFARTKEILRFNFLLQYFPFYYHHISNFSISYLLYAGVGYMWLLMGIQLKYIVAVGILIIIANLVYETWLPLLNTMDMMDAYYGIAGALLGFIFLLLVQKRGLRLNVI